MNNNDKQKHFFYNRDQVDDDNDQTVTQNVSMLEEHRARQQRGDPTSEMTHLSKSVYNQSAQDQIDSA